MHQTLDTGRRSSAFALRSTVICSAVRYSRIRAACVLPGRPEIPDVDIVEMEKIELKELQKRSTPGQVAKVAEDTG
jgi:hypothetical protein